MTNFEWLKSLGRKEMAIVLAYFADHQNHCWVGLDECEGCPIKVDGCCGYAVDPCDVSAFRWLGKEYNPKTIQLQYGDYKDMEEDEKT